MAAEQIGTGCPDGAAIGAKASEKVGFFGVAPVTQQAHINDPSTAATSLVAAVTAILDVLEAYGLTASS